VQSELRYGLVKCRLGPPDSQSDVYLYPGFEQLRGQLPFGDPKADIRLRHTLLVPQTVLLLALLPRDRPPCAHDFHRDVPDALLLRRLLLLYFLVRVCVLCVHGR